MRKGDCVHVEFDARIDGDMESDSTCVSLVIPVASRYSLSPIIMVPKWALTLAADQDKRQKSGS